MYSWRLQKNNRLLREHLGNLGTLPLSITNLKGAFFCLLGDNVEPTLVRLITRQYYKKCYYLPS